MSKKNLNLWPYLIYILKGALVFYWMRKRIDLVMKYGVRSRSRGLLYCCILWKVGVCVHVGWVGLMREGCVCHVKVASVGVRGGIPRMWEWGIWGFECRVYLLLEGGLIRDVLGWWRDPILLASQTSSHICIQLFPNMVSFLLVHTLVCIWTFSVVDELYVFGQYGNFRSVILSSSWCLWDICDIILCLSL